MKSISVHYTLQLLSFSFLSALYTVQDSVHHSKAVISWAEGGNQEENWQAMCCITVVEEISCIFGCHPDLPVLDACSQDTFSLGITLKIAVPDYYTGA